MMNEPKIYYIIRIPVADIYFMNDSAEALSWCNNIMDCKKFDTYEQASNHYEKIKDRTSNRDGQIIKIRYCNGIIDIL